MPKAGESLADWKARSLQWREARGLQPGAKKPRQQTLPADGLDWSERSVRALAEQREHNLEVQRGNYLPRDEVVEQWTQRVFAVRTRLLALPRTLGSRCANMPPDLVEAEADQVVRELLAEFLADGEYTPSPDTDGDAER